MMDDMSRRTEVPAGGIAEDNDRTNGKDEQAWQEGEKKEMKKKKKKRRRRRRRRKRRR